MKISVLDPAILDDNGCLSNNLGDIIIQRAVTRELRNLFGTCDIVRISTHVRMQPKHFENLQDSKYVFVGGSNLLGNSCFYPRERLLRLEGFRWRQWSISLCDAFKIRNAVLIGAGWWRYEGKAGLYTRRILKAALSKDALHSIRDEHTTKKLKKIGMYNVINTGCPTMWTLINIDQTNLPTDKADDVLMTLTCTQPKPEVDAKLIELLLAKYHRVYCWPQGKGDKDYVTSLRFPVIMLEHSLQSIEDFIRGEKNWDYIGTRLHGGILCLQAKRRTLILRIDNRATEITKDTGLFTVDRNDLASISLWIDGSARTEININREAVDSWRSQFKKSTG